MTFEKLPNYYSSYPNLYLHSYFHNYINLTTLFRKGRIAKGMNREMDGVRMLDDLLTGRIENGPIRDRTFNFCNIWKRWKYVWIAL